MDRRISRRRRTVFAEPPDNDSPLALSATEMAAKLGICEKSLLQSAIPRVRVNRRVLFVPDAVRAYLVENSFSPSLDDSGI